MKPMLLDSMSSKLDTSRPFRGQSLVGKKFGRLTVESFAGRKLREAYWLCKCECGNPATVRGEHMKAGNIISCGCARIRHGYAAGVRRHPMYDVWGTIIQRCNNPNYKHYVNYGGRGIRVCERWLKFENFLTDMGPGYKSGLCIERKNNNGNYEPGNCKWATYAEQSLNTRRNIRLSFRGLNLTMMEWSKITGIRYGRLRNRIMELGYSAEQALTMPPYKKRAK